MQNENLNMDNILEEFFQALTKLGYSKRSLAHYRACAGKFHAYACTMGDSPLFSQCVIDKFLAYVEETHPALTKTAMKRKRELVRFAIMLQDYTVNGAVMRHKLKNPDITKGFEPELAQFRDFGRKKGLSDASLKRICFVLGQLASYLYQHGRGSYAEMSSDDLTGFIKTQLGFARKTQSLVMYALRTFVCFLNEQHPDTLIDDSIIPCIRFVERRSLPTVWSDDECARLLSVVSRDCPKGKRDYAILMLAINLGMRQSDILGLELDDIDWERSTVSFVQQKTGKHNTLSLDQDTGWAIIDYLKYGRPESEYGKLFLRLNPPYVPLSGFYTNLCRYLTLAGLGKRSEGTMHGLHSFRHYVELIKMVSLWIES